MTLTIADASALIQALPPAPVILIDTCNFLDLFRAEEVQIKGAKAAFQPRVHHGEIRAAADLGDLTDAPAIAVHLIVPELIPREYADHADAIQTAFGEWTDLHDRNQVWCVEVSLRVASAQPLPLSIHPFALAGPLRNLAEALLAKAGVLERDQTCLDRAVHRLINKVRPSHKKELKDSMNLEQCLELSRQLQSAGFGRSRVWVSSNTNDFAQPKSSQIHADLQVDFAAAGLKYHTSLRSALGELRAAGEI